MTPAPRCKHCGQTEEEMVGPCQGAATHEIINVNPDPGVDVGLVGNSALPEVPTDPIDRLLWLLSNPQNEAVMNEPIPVHQLAMAIAALESVKVLREIRDTLSRSTGEEPEMERARRLR